MGATPSFNVLPTGQPQRSLIPTMPDYQLANRAGAINTGATRSATAAKSTLFGPGGGDLVAPNTASDLEYILRGLGRQIPIVGNFIDPVQAATWKTKTIEEIVNDPELLPRWQAMSDQEKHYALADGTDKLVKLISAPQEVYDALMGSTSTETINQQLVTQRTPGLLGAGLSPSRAPGVAGPAGAPPAGRRRVAGATQPAAAAGGAAGQPRVGEPRTTGIQDLRDAVPAIVISDRAGPPIGSRLMLSPSEFQLRVNQGLVQAAGDASTEIRMFRRRNPKTGVADGPVEQFSNAEFRASKQLQKDYVPVGEPKEGIVGGQRKYVGSEALQTGADVGVERARAPIAVENINDPTEVKWVDEGEALTLKGWRPVTVQERQMSEQNIERATNFRRRMPQAKRIFGLLKRMGPGGLAFTGKTGIAFGNMFKLLGMDVEADQISQALSGGDLSLTELASLESLIKSFVNSSKEEFINDERLSNKDQERIDKIGQIDQAFANQESIEYVIREFVRYGLISSELRLEAGGQASQFPVNTEDEFVKTIKGLTSFIGDADTAVEWAMSLREYPELN